MFYILNPSHRVKGIVCFLVGKNKPRASGEKLVIEISIFDFLLNNRLTRQVHKGMQMEGCAVLILFNPHYTCCLFGPHNVDKQTGPIWVNSCKMRIYESEDIKYMHLTSGTTRSVPNRYTGGTTVPAGVVKEPCQHGLPSLPPPQRFSAMPYSIFIFTEI